MSTIIFRQMPLFYRGKERYNMTLREISHQYSADAQRFDRRIRELERALVREPEAERQRQLKQNTLIIATQGAFVKWFFIFFGEKEPGRISPRNAL